MPAQGDGCAVRCARGAANGVARSIRVRTFAKFVVLLDESKNGKLERKVALKHKVLPQLVQGVRQDINQSRASQPPRQPAAEAIWPKSRLRACFETRVCVTMRKSNPSYHRCAKLATCPCWVSWPWLAPKTAHTVLRSTVTPKRMPTTHARDVFSTRPPTNAGDVYCYRRGVDIHPRRLVLADQAFDQAHRPLGHAFPPADATMRMTHDEGQRWFSLLMGARRYLEWGAGGTTVVGMHTGASNSDLQPIH